MSERTPVERLNAAADLIQTRAAETDRRRWYADDPSYRTTASQRRPRVRRLDPRE